MKFSLDGGRIRLNRTNPNSCVVSFESANYTDSGTWDITTFPCSRGRGKNHDKAVVVVDRGNIIYPVIYNISLGFFILFLKHVQLTCV